MRPLGLLLVVAVVGVAAWMLLTGGDAGDDVALEDDAATTASRETALAPTTNAPGAIPDIARAHAEADPAGEDGPIHGTCRVEGVVRGETGGPAIHAFVWATVGRRTVDAESGEGGRYALTLPAGTFVLRARHHRTGTASVEVTVPPDAARLDGPTLRLDEGGRIAGRVFESDGTPIEGFRVRCTAEDGTGLEFFTDSGTHVRFGGDDVLTGGDGGFVLRGLDADVPHTVLVDVTHRTDVKVEPKKLEGVVPDGAPVVFAVAATRSIEGRVVAAGSGDPIRWFTISGLRFDDEDGHFETTLPERGPVRFEAFGYEEQVREDLDLREGESRRGVTVTMTRLPDAGSLRVTVVDDAGRPVPEFSLGTRPLVTPSWSRSFDGRTDGVAVVEGFRAGPKFLLVRAMGHADTALRTTIESGAVAEANVTLRRGAEVRLRVLDPDGGPFTGDVAIEHTEGGGPHWRFRPAESRGTLLRVTEASILSDDMPSRGHLDPAEGRIVGLAAGSYVLSVYYGHEPKQVPFEVFPDTGIDLVVRP